MERKRLDKINAEKQRVLSNSKLALGPRVSSRTSVSSLKNLSTYRRQTLTGTSQLRSQRPMSRVSFSAADPNRVLKSIPQSGSENVLDPTKAGLHVEFKFSSQIDPVREHSSISPNQPKGLLSHAVRRWKTFLCLFRCDLRCEKISDDQYWRWDSSPSKQMQTSPSRYERENVRSLIHSSIENNDVSL